jgi:hypothetical protein
MDAEEFGSVFLVNGEEGEELEFVARKESC